MKPIRFMCAGLLGLMGIGGVASSHAHEPGGAGTAREFNHLKCYKIRDTNAVSQALGLTLETHQAALGFQNETCDIRKVKATTLCVDVRKNGEPAVSGTPLGDVPNAWDYLCYKIKCTPAASETLRTQGVIVKDQFAERRVLVSRVDTLCVPLTGQRVPDEVGCPAGGSNEACLAFSTDGNCDSCCHASVDCLTACFAAFQAGCADPVLNDACARETNEIGCHSVCCQ